MCKIIATLMMLLIVLLASGCAADSSESYGVFNESAVRRPGVQYCTIIGNAVWGIILFETVVAPVYFFGWSIMEPCENQ